jgi:hypothetical protein
VGDGRGVCDCERRFDKRKRGCDMNVQLKGVVSVRGERERKEECEQGRDKGKHDVRLRIDSQPIK